MTSTTNDAAMRMGVELTKHTLPAQIIEHLSAMYLAQPEKSATSFNDEFVAPLSADELLDPAALETELYERMQTVEGVSVVDLMQLSCAYAIRSIRLHDSGNSEAGWIDASFAQYWLGALAGVMLADRIAKTALATKARSGGLKRAERYAPLIERARELAAAGGYPSKRQAAKKIRDEIFVLSVEKGTPLAAEQAETTIYSWLKGMTFTGKQHTSTGPDKP
jgi:hypothetical protein